ncbi:TPA: NIPSNAP family protein [Pseudomonas aeruginosa]
MIIEMRTYYCLPGRLPALHERFQTTTLTFFNKHGIVPIGFWNTIIGPNNQTLTYMLRWKSMAEREEKWNAFQADQEWISLRTASEIPNGIVAKIENTFLSPTSYSPDFSIEEITHQTAT